MATNTTIDYTNIDNTLGGTAYQAALKSEFQHAEADMVTKLEIVSVPATATSTGVAGQCAFDATHAYFCYDTNLWRRVAISTF